MRRRRDFGKRLASLGSIAILLFTATDLANAEQKIEGDEPPHADEALLPLLADFESGSTEERIAAAMAIRELGIVAWPAIPALIDALADPIIGVRRSAAGALGGIGPTAAAAVPALTQRLADPHRFVRSWAAMALYEIGGPAKPATDALIHLMRTDTENLRGRSWAASALPEIGADASVVIPALVKTLAEDDSREVRAVVILSLQRYGKQGVRSPAITSSLFAALSDEEPLLRANASCALADLASELEVGRSAIALALRDEASIARSCAARAMGEMGRPALEWFDEVQKLTDDPEAHVRYEAERAIKRLREFSGRE